MPSESKPRTKLNLKKYLIILIVIISCKSKQENYYYPSLQKITSAEIDTIRLDHFESFSELVDKLENLNYYNKFGFLTLKKGNYSYKKPNKEDKADINRGFLLLNKSNKYKFTQGAVVRNKKIIAIEGRGGTQKML